MTLLFLLLSALRAASGQEVTIRVESNLVVVPITVIDRQGRNIPDLRQGDFRIYENGIEQTIAHFAGTQISLNVLLLLDRSGSMTDHFRELADAASLFVKQLAPNDRVSAASFADFPDEVLSPTRVSDLVKPITLRRHADDMTTNIFDAVDYGLKKMKKIAGRKAILLFSDGDGGGRYASAKGNLRDAQESDVVIYTIQFDTMPSEPPYKGPSKKKYREGIEAANKYMLDLAVKTGGRQLRIANIADLQSAFRFIANELSRQYSLSYYSTSPGRDGERRRIDVKTNIANVAVRSRNEVVYRKK